MPRTDWEQTWYESHVYADRCNNRWTWCPIHWTSIWYPSGPEHERYPLSFNIKTSESGWQTVWVYCGPGAYLPKRPS